MAAHFAFDEPLDISGLIRDIAEDIENRPTHFQYGPQAPSQTEFDVAVGALREAADKIEKAVYDASQK